MSKKTTSAGDKPTGVDLRKRGWFWGANELVTQYAPLIGLDGIGLLASYDVWTDQRRSSRTHGLAFPRREAEEIFYGINRRELAAIVQILEACELVSVTAHKVPRVMTIRGRKSQSYVLKNHYEIRHKDDYTLTEAIVLRVAELAEKNPRVFRRIAHIFTPDFCPIDSATRADKKVNPWYSILESVQQQPMWERLARRAERLAAQRERRADHVWASRKGTSGSQMTEGSKTSGPQMTKGSRTSGPQMTKGSRTSGPQMTTMQYQETNHAVPRNTTTTTKRAAQKNFNDAIAQISRHFAAQRGADYQPSPKDAKALRELLQAGYTASEICAAIDTGLAEFQPKRPASKIKSLTYFAPIVRRNPPGKAGANAQRPIEQDAETGTPEPTAVTGKPRAEPQSNAGLTLDKLAGGDGELRDLLEVVQECSPGHPLRKADVRAWKKLADDFRDFADAQGLSPNGLVMQAVLEAIGSKSDRHGYLAPNLARRILERWQTEHALAQQARSLAAEAVGVSAAAPGTPAMALPRINTTLGEMDVQTAWQGVLDDLQLQMTRATFETWLKNTRVVGYEDGVFTIGVPNTYAVEWLDNRLLPTIRRAVVKLMGCPVELRFVVPASPKHGG